jgi:protein MpaA
VTLALATVALLLAAGGREFENGVYGHTVRLPGGWQGAVEPESGLTNVSTYRVRRLRSYYERPPARRIRIVLFGYGRTACPRGSFRQGERIRLGRRSTFEGFGEGYNVLLCRRGHSLQAFVKAGPSVAQARLAEARSILASVRLTPRADEIANIHSSRVLGRSELGRPIRAWRIGNPRAPRRVLVVGCIHGNECAGMAVTQRLLNLPRPIALDLWVIQNLNPDGLARATRGNARGVDLNRDFAAATQRETRIARNLISRLRPDVTIWFHQPQAVVRAWGRSRGTARRYARLAGARYRSLPWPVGAATRWQNGLGQISFVVELAAGALTDARAERHARAVLRVGD